MLSQRAVPTESSNHWGKKEAFLISICIISITFLIIIKTIAIKVGIQFNGDKSCSLNIVCQKLLKVSYSSFCHSTKTTPAIHFHKYVYALLISHFTIIVTTVLYRHLNPTDLYSAPNLGRF